MHITPSIFKAYDIRGIVPSTIHEAMAEGLGKAFGTQALAEFGLFEHLYVQPQAWFGGEVLAPQGGRIAIPDRPGIGFEPDAQVLQRFAVR